MDLSAGAPPQAYIDAWGDCTPVYARGPIAGDPGYWISINRIALNPGAHGTPHRHHTTEYLTFVSGIGKVVIDGQAPVQARPQTSVVVPAGVLHHIENTNDAAQLVYMAIHIGTERNVILDETNTPHGCPPTVR